jgi:hypothetical protein
MKLALRGVLVALAFAMPCLSQDKKPLPQAKEIAEFKKRTKVEPYQENGLDKVKITADETCLYDGPGKNGRVEVEVRQPPEGPIFISVRVVGEEVARFWVRSLAKPAKFPPTVMANPDRANYSSNSQSTNGKSSCKIDMAGVTIYEGPGSDVKHELLGKGEKQSYSIRVDEEIVYLAPVHRAVKKDGEAGKSPAVGEKKEPGQERGPGGNSNGIVLSGETAIAAVIARLNLYRKGAGLGEVVEDKDLSKACQLHAEYLGSNRDKVDADWHREDPERKGYSAAGAKCAPRSVVHDSSWSRDPKYAVDGLMATLYHRVSLLRPQLASVGVGMVEYGENGLVLVMDVESLKWDIKVAVRPVLYPYADQKDVPLDFGGREWPDPIPEKGSPAGFPITITWDPLGWKPGEATACLRSGEVEIPCWVSTPEKPALADRAQAGVICLIPKAPLKSQTQYTVVLKCKQYGLEKTPEWSKTWSFTTAGKP